MALLSPAVRKRTTGYGGTRPIHRGLATMTGYFIYLTLVPPSEYALDALVGGSNLDAHHDHE